MKNQVLKASNPILFLNERKTHDRKVSTVKQLKRKYHNVPLNFLFGIGDELDFQCPSIDEYIEKISICKESLLKARRARNLNSKNGHIVKALYALNNLDTDLDFNTRNNFMTLRDYARKWKLFAIKILDATKSPEKFIIK